MANDICPACGQSIQQRTVGTTGKRICWKCNKKIGRHDKWQFGSGSRPEHKDCTRPDGKPRAESMSLGL